MLANPQTVPLLVFGLKTARKKTWVLRLLANAVGVRDGGQPSLPSLTGSTPADRGRLFGPSSGRQSLCGHLLEPATTCD